MDVAKLKSMLDDYAAFDDNEAMHLSKTREFFHSNANDSAFSRGTPEGHITASCFILNEAMDKTLFLHHGKLNRWLQPGGHVEADDSDFLSAVLREAMEETGVKDLRFFSEDIFDIDAHPIPAHDKKNEPAHTHFDIRMLLIAPNEDFAISDESSDIKWLTADEVEAFNSVSLNRFVRKWRTLLDN